MEDAKIQLTYKIDKVLNYAVIYNGFPIIHDICIKKYLGHELPLPCGAMAPMEVLSNSRDSYPFLTKKSGCPYQLRHIHLCHYPFDRNTFRVQFVESIHFWG